MDASGSISMGIGNKPNSWGDANGSTSIASPATIAPPRRLPGFSSLAGSTLLRKATCRSRSKTPRIW